MPRGGARRPRPAAGRCEALAEALAGSGVAVGLGGWHEGLAGVAVGFAEAREAADRAEPGTAVAFDDVLVTHLLRTSPDADRLLGELLEPVSRYDAERGADLVATLRSYVQCGFSPTRSAQQLIVHPNTVHYRLKRIRELTGRDPQGAGRPRAARARPGAPRRGLGRRPAFVACRRRALSKSSDARISCVRGRTYGAWRRRRKGFP